jgi:hypothetical protein
MALYNFVDSVYDPVFTAFARPVTVTPIKSQPGQPAYSSVGYFDSTSLDVIGEGMSVISDAKLSLDIHILHFSILPMQGDEIDMPMHQKAPGGMFLVLDVSPDNAQGMHTLTLRYLGASRPTPSP